MTPFSPGKSPAAIHEKTPVKDLWHCPNITTQPHVPSFLGHRNSEAPAYSCFLPSSHHLRCKADGDEAATLLRQAIKYRRLATTRTAFAHPAVTAQSASAPMQEVIRPTARLQTFSYIIRLPTRACETNTLHVPTLLLWRDRLERW